MDVEFEPLYPFGLVITPASGAAVPSLADVDMTKLRKLSEFNSPVVIRGFQDTKNREIFVGKGSEMGTIMPWNKGVDEEDANKPWKFGVVFEVKDSGLTGQVSDEALPMHYDGVFKIEKQLDKNGKEISVSQAPRFEFPSTLPVIFSHLVREFRSSKGKILTQIKHPQISILHRCDTLPQGYWLYTVCVFTCPFQLPSLTAHGRVTVKHYMVCKDENIR